MHSPLKKMPPCSRRIFQIKQFTQLSNLTQAGRFIQTKTLLLKQSFTDFNFKKTLSLPLRLLISFQMVFAPLHSFSSAEPSSHFTEEEIKESHSKQIVQKHNEDVESLRRLIFLDSSQKDPQMDTENPLDLFSLLRQSVEKVIIKGEPKPYFRYVNPKKIQIEVLNDSGEVVSRLDRKTESTFSAPPNSSDSSNQKYQFRISYKTKILHTFLHTVEWISFVDHYIVFKSNTSESHLLFIDLDYFASALGKTTLPLFKIPLLKNKKSFSPQFKVNEKGLSIHSHQITFQDFLFFSKLQQMTFNTMVSLVDPETYMDVKPVLKNIIDVYVKSFEKENATLVEKFNSQKENSYERLKEFLTQSLYLRGKQGSAQDITGVYGTFKTAEKGLEPESKRQVVQDFSENLKKEEAFQTALLGLSAQREMEQKILNRFLVFTSRIIAPQPLGSPKIRTALGLIASSMNPRLNKSSPEEAVQGRKELLQKGLSDFASNRNARIGLPLLAGLGLAVNHPELGPMLHQPLSAIGTWTSHFFEIIKISFDGMTTFVNPKDLQEIYVSDGKFSKFLVGTGALFGIFFASMGFIHLVTNSYFYTKDFRKSKIEGFKNHFIDYMRRGKIQFIKDLAAAERRKIGLSIDFILPDGTMHKGLFRSTTSWKQLLLNFSSDPNVKVTFSSLSGDKIPLVLHTAQAGDSDSEKVIVKISTSESKTFEREFVLEKGYLNDYLESERSQESVTKNLHIRGSAFNMQGQFLEAEFSKKEELFIRDVLNQIKSQGKGKNTKDQGELSEKEIKTLWQAIAHLFIGYSSWSKTFYFLGKLWNQWFFGRSFFLRPITFSTMIYHSHYYDRLYKKRHRPTHLNGGLGFAPFTLKKYFNKRESEGNLKQSIKQNLKRLNEFESKIIPIERQYLKAATEQALIITLRKSTEDPRLVEVLKDGISNNPPLLRKSKYKKYRLFFRAYQEELFHGAVLDYLKEHSGLQGTEEQIKSHYVEDIQREIEFPKESMDQVRERIQKIVSEDQLEQKALDITQDLSQFVRRRRMKRALSMERILDPKEAIVMERYDVAENGLNDSEGMARVTRQQLTKLAIDKPIEFVFLILLMAGLDSGLLKVLHDEKFSEEAFFHFSRYVVWFGFFGNIVMESLGGAWGKIQADYRLDALGGFDVIPKKEDVQKRFAATRWYWKQTLSKENSFWLNYKYFARVAIANIPAALFTLVLFNFVSLGRFDLDAYLAGYLVVFALGPGGLYYKFENAFEKSANFSLQKLVQKGLDLDGTHKKFLSHPLIQAFKTRELAKLRAKYNFKYAILMENPMAFVEDVFANVDISLGSRGFSRLFFGGHLITEYLIGTMDSLSRAHLIPDSWSESCKALFIKNRTDL